MRDCFGEDHHVARLQRHFVDDWIPVVDCLWTYEVGLVRARDAAESATTGRMLDHGPLHTDKTAVDASLADLVVLRRVERSPATMHPQPLVPGAI